jgi:hypothetical protein
MRAGTVVTVRLADAGEMGEVHFCFTSVKVRVDDEPTSDCPIRVNRCDEISFIGGDTALNRYLYATCGT